MPAFSSQQSGPDMSAFYRHVEDTHLDPHPQYRLESTLLTQADIASGYRLAGSSSGAPSSPVRGDIWVDTDSMEHWLYYGATTGWARPWNIPWGVLDTTQVTADQAGITGTSNLTSLSLTVTLLANRTYKTTGNALFTTDAAGQVGILVVADGTSTALGRIGQLESPDASADLVMSGAYVEENSTTVTVIRKLMLVVAGGGNIDLRAGSGYPAQITVEDIGPYGTAPLA